MAEPVRVGMLVRNLFLRVPVDAAVRAAGAEPVVISGAEEASRFSCRAVLVDLDAAGEGAPAIIAAMVQQGITVLAFGPHVEAERLAAARKAGAVALPRGSFLARLPELLAVALGGSSSAP